MSSDVSQARDVGVACVCANGDRLRSEALALGNPILIQTQELFFEEGHGRGSARNIHCITGGGIGGRGQVSQPARIFVCLSICLSVQNYVSLLSVYPEVCPEV